MVIKTITCHQSTNHGAMLQAYALPCYLKTLGHDVQVIDYRPGYMTERHRVPSRYNHFGIRQLYLLAKLPEDFGGWMRHRALLPFFKQYMPITPHQYRTIDQLTNEPPKADLYIAGSDQIWNTFFQNGSDAAFYLDFGTPKRKISYAASFATRELKAGTEGFVKRQLRNFDSISVREESGLELLKSLGYEGTVVVDPVFLLSGREWSNILALESHEGDYILTYDFEKKNSPIGRLAKRLAALLNCKIYSVSPFARDYADQSFVCCGPDKFVSLIRDARCVISNSFHGTAFSLIFERNFFVVNRMDGLNVRMQDLLSRYGLDHRLITEDVSDDSLLEGVLYKQVNKMLSQDIDYSKAFLQRQISIAH